MINITNLIISFPQKNGSVITAPFVMAIDHAKNNHVPCWLEWWGGEFNASDALKSAQPDEPKDNVLERFRMLPPLTLSSAGKTVASFRAVCDRSMGGDVGVIPCDGGTLWTVLPP